MLKQFPIDLYRGIGVLLVLWGHAGLPGLPGAFLGIDTFFVISGFLITLSYVRIYEKRSNTEHFRRIVSVSWIFLEFRIRRILFPLLATVLLTLGIGWLVLLPDDLVNLAHASAHSVLLSANIFAAQSGDYFTSLGETYPLLHIWSLSLEEQFYLASIPLLAISTISKRGLWFFWIFTLTLALISLMVAQIYTSSIATKHQGYYLFTTRIWQFLIGMMIAQIYLRCSNQIENANANLATLLHYLGWLLIISGMIVLSPSNSLPGYLSIQPVIGICLIILFRPKKISKVTTTLAKPFQFIGRHLYGVYLLHYPIMMISFYVLPEIHFEHRIMVFLMSTTLGLALGYAIETPFKKWRKIKFRWIFTINFVAIITILTLVVIIVESNGALYRLNPSAQKAYAAKYLVNPFREKCISSPNTSHGYSCIYNPEFSDKVVLIGDSHSDAIAHQLSISLAENGVSLHHYWFADCPAISRQLHILKSYSDTCENLSAEAISAASTLDQVKLVIFSLYWPRYFYAEPSATQQISDYNRSFDSESEQHAETVSIKKLAEETFLSLEEAGKIILLLDTVPVFKHNVPERMAKNLWYPFLLNQRNLKFPNSASEKQNLNQSIENIFPIPLSNDDIALFSTKNVFCEKENCIHSKDKIPFYYDNNHLNEIGAEYLLSFLKAEFTALSILPGLLR